ncbi:MAG: peptidoglycan-binding protein [Alphaproteobacteria bacterium]|nr:peptidoglycan-binding protein [Alphaproteobacteria bacterium]
MTSFSRKLAFSAALACLALALGATPASAKTKHHHAKTHHVHHRRGRKASRGSAIVRIAQEHLSNLGCYTGKVDGVMGPKTRAAIKRFQREHGLRASGALDKKTSRAIENADHLMIGSHSQLLTHESVTSSDEAVNQDYDVSLNGGTKIVNSRFARLDVSESGSGADKRYNVNVNGQPILTADGQPSIIGVSPSYDLGNEDAVVFTTYSPNDSGCIYRNHVLAMDDKGTKMLDITNCTRDYQARVENGSLYITFPEHDDNRAVGAIWRLEGMNLNRL